jgi:hypothetical protein
MITLRDIAFFCIRCCKALSGRALEPPDRSIHKRPYFFTIITRFKNEPFAAEFVSYYLSQGADRIFILDDHSSLPYDEAVLSNSDVTIIPLHTFVKHQMYGAHRLYQRIRNTSTWFAFVDADEFITTKRNPHRTIGRELEQNFRDVDCIKVPWVMMSGNKREKDPESLLGEIIHRWDHDRRHPHPYQWYKGHCRYDHIEVKCIFRGAAFTGLGHPHYPCGPVSRCVRIVDSVNIRDVDLDAFYPGLRERDIRAGHLLCYHYRIISRQSCLRKTAETNFPGYRTDVKNLLACDYPELIDRTLQEKLPRPHA